MNFKGRNEKHSRYRSRRSLFAAIVCMLMLIPAGCITKATDPAAMGAQEKPAVQADDERDAADAGKESAVAEITAADAAGTAEEEPTAETQTSNADTRVVVWGDSLTEGTGGDGVTYPNVLERLAGCEVKNYGIYAETTSCIAGRQGGMAENVHPVTIPAEVTDVDVEIENGDGNWDLILVFGDAGINPCTIAGVEGRLWMDFDTGQRKFTRNEPGEEVVLTEGTPIETFAMKDKRPDDILVIFTGSNDDPTPETVQSVIDLQRDMIAYAGVERYVVIGLTSKRKMPMAAEVNEVLAKEYGEYFLDVRKDLLEHGLQDSGIEPTAEDRTDIAGGYIPRSLLMSEAADESHGNAAYYTVIGEALYQKLQELGYLK